MLYLRKAIRVILIYEQALASPSQRQAFFSRQDWQRHVDQHNRHTSRQHTCSQCGKDFSRVSSLNRHKLKAKGLCAERITAVIATRSRRVHGATNPAPVESVRHSTAWQVQNLPGRANPAALAPPVPVQTTGSLPSSTPNTSFADSAFNGRDDDSHKGDRTHLDHSTVCAIEGLNKSGLSGPSKSGKRVDWVSYLPSGGVVVNDDQVQAVEKLFNAPSTRIYLDPQASPSATLRSDGTIAMSLYDLRVAWFLAVRRGYLHETDALGNLNCLLNDREYGYGRTALHIAAEQGDVTVLRCLLSKPQIDVNLVGAISYVGGCHDTPLTLAMRFCKLEAVACLLEAGADIHVPVIQSGDSTTSVLMSTKRRFSLKIRRLLLLHVKTHDLTLRGTPLMPLGDAVGCVETMELLLELGADIHAMNIDGCTALHVACEMGRPETVRFLLQHGADVNSKDKAGASPLLSCTRSTSANTTKILLESGTDVNACDIDGHTALHTACYFKRLYHVQLLLRHGADANVQEIETGSPLHYLVDGLLPSTLENIRSIVKDLVRHGADLDTFAPNGTPLIFASRRRTQYMKRDHPILWTNTIHALVEEGASLNVIDRSRKTALDHVLDTMASRQCRQWCSQDPALLPDLIKYLFEKGAMSGKQVAADQDSDADWCYPDSDWDDSSVTAQ